MDLILLMVEIERITLENDNMFIKPTILNKSDRDASAKQKGKVIWFTGLSGSGKTTLANALDLNLIRLGLDTFVLDGDKLREGLNKDLGFTEVDRSENIRRVGEVAKLMLDAGLIVLCAFISPIERDRKIVREIVGKGKLFEVYVNTPLDVCEQRDVKGLYCKARSGELSNFTGISSPYEPPQFPDFTIDTSQKSFALAVEELTLAVTNSMKINQLNFRIINRNEKS